VNESTANLGKPFTVNVVIPRDNTSKAKIEEDCTKNIEDWFQKGRGYKELHVEFLIDIKVNPKNLAKSDITVPSNEDSIVKEDGVLIVKLTDEQQTRALENGLFVFARFNYSDNNERLTDGKDICAYNNRGDPYISGKELDEKPLFTIQVKKLGVVVDLK